MRPRSLNFLLSLVFSFFLLLVTVLGLFSIERLSEFNRSAADVRDIWLPSTRFIGDLNNFTSDFRAAEGRHLLSSTPAESTASKKEIADLGQAVVLAESGYEGLRHSPDVAAQYGQFKQKWIDYRKIVDQVLQLYTAGQTSEAIDLYRTTSQSTYNAASDALERVTHLNIASANAASDQADAAYRNARAFIGVAVVIAAVLVLAALFYVKRFVSTPLLDLAGCMRRLADNDTDIEIRGIQRIDEIGEMARALVVFRTNAIELMLGQRSLSQQASMLEEKLAQEQRLTQLQQDFVSMASHEFRTPLTVIDGQAQRLVKIGDRAPAGEIIDRAKRIRRAVLQMTTMIDHLLNSSRLIDHGAQLYFHPDAVDLRALLQEVCVLHREIAPRSPITQRLGTVDTATLPVFGDSKLLFQMFSNLISNAVKYSDDGHRIDVTADIETEQVIVTVQDHGIGIPQKDLAHVFGRYNRGSNVSGIVGTGVGLYLVRMVVDLHGGTVAVESKEGEGSRFTVRLPIWRPSQTEILSLSTEFVQEYAAAADGS
ncbi:MAG: ATP-binding protein [Bradyrhizobium sp.]|nr:ATP-binding protein [Bradyrhizobium sp.]